MGLSDLFGQKRQVLAPCRKKQVAGYAAQDLRRLLHRSRFIYSKPAIRQFPFRVPCKAQIRNFCLLAGFSDLRRNLRRERMGRINDAGIALLTDQKFHLLLCESSLQDSPPFSRSEDLRSVFRRHTHRAAHSCPRKMLREFAPFRCPCKDKDLCAKFTHCLLLLTFPICIRAASPFCCPAALCCCFR